jgi:hypothetical protein
MKTSSRPVEILKILERTPEVLAELVADLPLERIKEKRAREEFSILENVCHLRDIEIEGYSARINRILNEKQPTLPDIDGSRLALERDYNSQDIAQALRAFATARKQNIETLNELKPEQFRREGYLEGVGLIDLSRLLLLMSDHDEGHVQELGHLLNTRQ